MKLKTENLTLKTFLALALYTAHFTPGFAQTNTNSVTASFRTLTVSSNGVLLAPTNFFATNRALISAIIAGGGTGVSSNLVATGAVFDTGTNPTTVPGWQLPALATNQLYYIKYTGTNAEYIGDSAGNYFNQITPAGGNTGAQSGVFSVATGGDSGDLTPTPPFYIVAYDNAATAPGKPVDAQVYAITTNMLAGMFAGTFDGVLSSNCLVPDSTLPNTIQRKFKALNSLASTYDEANFITGSNTLHGSTLTIQALGSYGYADINFETGTTLRGALGCGVLGDNQWPYNSPYWELYGQNDFNWVQGGVGIMGQVNGGSGNLKWFSNDNNTNGTATNSVFFETVRSNSAVVIGGPLGGFAIIVKATNGPSAAFLGANYSVGLWTSNGVLYARTSANGTTFTDKQIAP